MKRIPIGRAKRKPVQIRRMSAKKKQQIIDEVRIRVALCQRCGGVWVPTSSLTGGYCKGGNCELCGKPSGNEILKPHEEQHRSQGGKLSLENSKMSHLICHLAKHGIKAMKSSPEWRE